MLKKYTSNKYFSLTDNNENKEVYQNEKNAPKIITQIKYKNPDDRNDSQLKNTILLKDILKSNSITQNNNKENILIKYKNKMSSKNGILPQKNSKQKSKNKLKAKIKTTFSNYYTDYLFKNSLNANKQNLNNFTEITYKADETEELNETNTNEKTIKASRLKYSGFYNTDSNNKINFNMEININKSKEFSPSKKGSIAISPKNYKKIKQMTKKENFNNYIVKIQKLRKGKISDNSKNLIYINNLNESNNLSNSNNMSKSNKNLKKYKEVYKEEKNDIIKNKKTNNLIQNKKQYFKKISEKNMERNKQNKISEYDGKLNNKTSNKINIHNVRKYIFLSPMIKSNTSLDKKKSSSKKLKKSNNNNLYQYKPASSTTNKEIKNILFKFNEGRNSVQKKKINRISKNGQNNKLFIKKENKGKIAIQDNSPKILGKKKENSSTIKSEDKKTEKDFNLENNKIIEKNTSTNSKNLRDYFKMARNVLKNASHSLIESIATSNNFYEDIEFFEFRDRVNETGQITNRNNEIEKDNDSNNYTIKKVPVFSAINMFPSKNIKNNILANYDNILYKLFILSKEIKNNKKNNNNISKSILYFFDVKSLIILSSLNKDFYNNFRSIFYKTIFNKIYKNKNIKFIKKLNISLIRSVSVQYKSDIYKKTSNQTPYLDIIINDIDRTFPKDSKFRKDGKNYKKLFNILTKYSNYNKDIGYAQGLNFLFANALLLYENEKDAFFYIDGMIKKFKLKKFFAEKNSKLIEEIAKFSKILKKYTPEIVDFFDKKYIYHEFFSTGWILTLFSNAMEPKNLFICWNFMNILGWKFFYCFVIQILKFYKLTIFTTNENELSHLMKNLLKEKKFDDDLPNILKNTFNFMEKHILL